MQEPDTGVLALELAGAVVALFPQDREPAQGAGALGCEEPGAAGAVDAEFWQERGPGAVGDFPGADVLDQITCVELDGAVPAELNIDTVSAGLGAKPAEQVSGGGMAGEGTVSRRVMVYADVIADGSFSRESTC